MSLVIYSYYKGQMREKFVENINNINEKKFPGFSFV